MRTRYGPGVSIPTDNGAEIEALAGSNPSFTAWEQSTERIDGLVALIMVIGRVTVKEHVMDTRRPFG